MADVPYDTLADVYDWLAPDGVLTPQGSAAAFEEHVEPGARVLDCACGTGTLAVGLALRGHEVMATDASPAMVERTERLAAEHRARVGSSVCTWEALAGRGWEAAFDVVLCVGNSLAHAVGRDGRRAALQAMAGVLRAGGLLVLTSRTWEQVRAGGSRLEVGERLVERDGRHGLPIYAWTIAERWDEPHAFDVAVALIGDDGAVTTRAEHFAFWPYTEDELREDLRSVGLEPSPATAPEDRAARYLLTARRPG
jgi:SAM-dependent methyltransferase